MAEDTSHTGTNTNWGCYWSGQHSNEDNTTSEFSETLGMMGVQLEEGEIFQWLESDTADPGFQILTDDEIFKVAMQVYVESKPDKE